MFDFELSTAGVFCREANSGFSFEDNKEEEAMKETPEDKCAFEMPIVASYSRREALEDGVLIDVTETAREAGLCSPVAITRLVWSRYVEVPPEATCQDLEGRLWDLLTMLRFGILDATRHIRTSGPYLFFDLVVANDGGAPRRVRLKAHYGPADDETPVLTVMLPEED